MNTPEVLDSLGTVSLVEAELAPDHQSLIDERSRLGLDQFDELWDGVLHMNPQPARWHQGLSGQLYRLLAPNADERDLDSYFEISIYRADDDHRSPDLAFSRRDQRIELGLSGSVLVVEILSPRDEAHRKLRWYADRGVEEMLLVDPRRLTVELYRSIDGDIPLIGPDVDGMVALDTLGVRLGPALDIDGVPALRVYVGDVAPHDLRDR